MMAAKRADGLRPDVEAHGAPRDAAPPGPPDGGRRRRSDPPPPGQWAGRRREPKSAAEHRAHLVHHVGFHLGVAHLVALGGQQGEAHRPADEHGVDLGQQGPDHAELVGHLGPAEHHHIGAVGVAAAGGRRPRSPRPAAGPAADGSRSATPTVEEWARWAEPKASSTKKSARRGEGIRERRVVLRLPRGEAGVLEDDHLARGGRGHGLARPVAGHIGGAAHREPAQFAQAGGHRGHGELRVGAPWAAPGGCTPPPGRPARAVPRWCAGSTRCGNRPRPGPRRGARSGRPAPARCGPTPRGRRWCGTSSKAPPASRTRSR